MKIFFISAAVVAAAAFGVMKANVNVNDKMSDLQLDNVEALADPPEPGTVTTTYQNAGPSSKGPFMAGQQVYSTTIEVENEGSAGVSWPWGSAKGSRKNKKTKTTVYYYYPCQNANSNDCQPYQTETVIYN